MAKKRSASATPASRAVSADRATRLYRLLELLGAGPKTREVLRKRLGLDVRGFYRDLELLRTAGIEIRLEKQRYSLESELPELLLKLPFPDPGLTLGEAMQLARGRSAAHRRLKAQIAAVTGSR